MPESDKPIQRTLRVGAVSVGLIGLDMAMAGVLAKHMSDAEAVDALFRAVAEQNYIPRGAEPRYREALAREYAAARSGRPENEKRLVIRVLGPGCVSCNRIYTMSVEILQKYGIAADIESVRELDEVWRHGVTTTPALIINGEVKSAGRLPMPIEIEAWIREAAGIG